MRIRGFAPVVNTAGKFGRVANPTAKHVRLRLQQPPYLYDTEERAFAVPA